MVMEIQQLLYSDYCSLIWTKAFDKLSPPKYSNQWFESGNSIRPSDSCLIWLLPNNLWGASGMKPTDTTRKKDMKNPGDSRVCCQRLKSVSAQPNMKPSRWSTRNWSDCTGISDRWSWRGRMLKAGANPLWSDCPPICSESFPAWAGFLSRISGICVSFIRNIKML